MKILAVISHGYFITNNHTRVLDANICERLNQNAHKEKIRSYRFQQSNSVLC